MKFGAVHLLRCCEEVVLMFKKNSRNSQKFGHEDQSSMPRTHIKAKQTNKQRNKSRCAIVTLALGKLRQEGPSGLQASPRFPRHKGSNS